jgi:hypothetical protein
VSRSDPQVLSCFPSCPGLTHRYFVPNPSANEKQSDGKDAPPKELMLLKGISGAVVAVSAAGWARPGRAVCAATAACARETTPTAGQQCKQAGPARNCMVHAHGLP